MGKQAKVEPDAAPAPQRCGGMAAPDVDDDIMGAPPVDVGALAPVDAATGQPTTPNRQTLGRGANRLRQSLHAGAAGAALRFQRTATSVDQQGGLAASLEVFQERHAGGPRRRPPKKRRDPLAASPFAAPVKRPPRPKSAGGASQVAQAMAKYGRGPPVGGGAAAARPRSAEAMSRSAPLLGRPATVVARAVATLGQGTQPTPLQRMRALEMELSLPMRDRKAVTDMVKAAHVAGRVPPRGRERVMQLCSARARSRKRIDAPRDDRSSQNLSRNEWNAAERGAFEVGNVAPFSCPVCHARDAPRKWSRPQRRSMKL